MKSTDDKRGYRSAKRDAATAETRARIVEAASRLLGSGDPAASGMEAVAKAAGVSRLTVYNQFGSRRGLLEAVFDDRARAGGLTRIPEAMAMRDPEAALMRLVEIFCGFWSFDPALGRLHQEAQWDDEFAAALVERNERRRKALSVLVQRLAKAGAVGPRRDLTDALFMLTSQATYRSLAVNGREPVAICALVRRLCASTIAAWGD
jgi:AcrR family transcriptional regulator